MSSHEYIFKESEGKFKFCGDFESLYQNIEDPWLQSASKKTNGEVGMVNFYNISRKMLTNFLSGYVKDEDSICDCGCGNGHLTKSLQMEFHKQTVSGCDISKTAIKNAKKSFEDIEFIHHDILSGPLPQKFNFIILSNILWYVIHDFEILIKNSLGSLKRSEKSFLVIQNALFKSDQKYFREIVNSIGTLTDLFVNPMRQISKIGGNLAVNTAFFSKDEMKHDFGIVLIEVPRCS